MREVAGDPVQLALGARLQRRLEALIELLQGQPALGVVLAQFCRRGLALSVPDAKVWSCRHLILRLR
jgi:hypothetical protein